jgi:hypothetical protein
MTHTERTHLLFGAGLALMGLLAMLAGARRSEVARSAWPVLAIAIGVVLFIPVESQTRTYSSMEWGAYLLTLAPDDPTRWIGDWIRYAHAGHVAQHKLGGMVAMIAGLVELGIARRWLRSPAWPYLLPVCLVTVGLAFGVHGGSSHHLPFSTEQLHHRLLGLGLVVGGGTLGLHQAGVLRHRYWTMVWPVLALLAGLGLTFFYRLPTDASGHGVHRALEQSLTAGGFP